MKRQTVEITVPVYNEEEELTEHIGTLAKFCKENLRDYSWHITIADNASNDNTPIITSTLAKKEPMISLLRIEQRGRGRAVKRAWSQSEADYCVYMDLDLSTDLVHLPRIIKALERGYDIAIGSRLVSGARVEGRSIVREFISRSLNFILIHTLFQTHFTDAQCGFKAVTRKVVDELIPYIFDNDWFFDGELLIVAEKSGYKIYEEPVHWVDNPGSTVRLYSTILNDLKVMARLLLKKPWRRIKKKGLHRDDRT